MVRGWGLGPGAEVGREARRGGGAGLVNMTQPISRGAQVGPAEAGVGCAEVKLRVEGGELLAAGGRTGLGVRRGSTFVTPWRAVRTHRWTKPSACPSHRQ